MDFADPDLARTYSGRSADPGWRAAVTALVDPVGAEVVDVGCGGGTYTRAWHELGAAGVVGIDASPPILAAAAADHGALSGVRFSLGRAQATGLAGASADVVFMRALVHHVADLFPVATEAARLLRPGGTLLIQDRTMADVRQPGSATHPRGWVFELFPRLLDVEAGRRPGSATVEAALLASGLRDVTVTGLTETRRVHPYREAYLAEVASRTGRSILHELDDPELARLVDGLRDRLPDGPVTETDRWTLWRATR